jgi:hypothetical protein
MNFALTDDQLLLRDTVSQFMEAELRPFTAKQQRV